MSPLLSQKGSYQGVHFMTKRCLASHTVGVSFLL